MTTDLGNPELHRLIRTWKGALAAAERHEEGTVERVEAELWIMLDHSNDIVDAIRVISGDKAADGLEESFKIRTLDLVARWEALQQETFPQHPCTRN
jgi:hypothetical protein